MVINHPRATTFPAPLDRPPNFAQLAGAGRNVTRVGLNNNVLLQSRIVFVTEQLQHICRKNRRVYEDRGASYVNDLVLEM